MVLQVKKELQQEKEKSSTEQKAVAPEEVSTLKRSLEVISLLLCPSAFCCYMCSNRGG